MLAGVIHDTLSPMHWSTALIVAVARGKRELIWKRDRLQDAVDIKLAILAGLEREEAGYGE